jgi:threonine dehydrogenase-like Zn-dependent dehydrogenase
MGQMHVQRAIEKPDPPSLVLGTDVDSQRLAWMADYLGPLAKERNVEMVAMNPTELSAEEQDARLRELAPQGFDDVVVTAPVGALAGQGFDYLALGGVLNIFAGVPRGTAADIDLAGVYLRDQRMVGSSGSRVIDLQDTLAATEQGHLATNRALAAIGGIDAVREGLEGVKTGRFHGKVVIFPQIEELGLVPLDQLPEQLPEVAARLAPDGSWTREAEEELLREQLPEASA